MDGGDQFCDQNPHICSNAVNRLFFCMYIVCCCERDVVDLKFVIEERTEKSNGVTFPPPLPPLPLSNREEGEKKEITNDSQRHHTTNFGIHSH